MGEVFGALLWTQRAADFTASELPAKRSSELYELSAAERRVEMSDAFSVGAHLQGGDTIAGEGCTTATKRASIKMSCARRFGAFGAVVATPSEPSAEHSDPRHVYPKGSSHLRETEYGRAMGMTSMFGSRHAPSKTWTAGPALRRSGRTRLAEGVTFSSMSPSSYLRQKRRSCTVSTVQSDASLDRGSVQNDASLRRWATAHEQLKRPPTRTEGRRCHRSAPRTQRPGTTRLGRRIWRPPTRQL